jgi:type-F conjugative transfer system pilin assembly protein TrbC
MKVISILILLIGFFTTIVYAENNNELLERYRHTNKLFDEAEAQAYSSKSRIGDIVPIDKTQLKEKIDTAYDQFKNVKTITNEELDQAEKYMRENLNNSNNNKTVATAASQAIGNKVDGLDPAELASLYRKAEKDMDKKNEGPVLMIFASTSIPPQTLQVIGQQAKLAAAPIFLRGVNGGFTMAGITQTLKAMRPATEQGAEVQIHPEMFKHYGVTQVPAIILAEHLGGTCGQTTCGEHRMVVGDVTVEYALAQFEREGGALGKIAREKLNQMDLGAGK